jgi:hypothetical protein
MNSKIKSVVFSVSLIALLAVTSLAFAQPQVNIPGTDTASDITSANELLNVVKSIIGWVYAIFFVLAVLFILMAAFTYLGAAGDETKLAKAKNQIIYAAVAVVVALLAVGFSQIVGSIIGGEGPSL